MIFPLEEGFKNKTNLKIHNLSSLLPTEVEKILMAIETIDVRGLKSPNSLLTIVTKILTMKKGDIVDVWGDCPTFEKDVRAWCEETQRVFFSVEIEDGSKKIRIQI